MERKALFEKINANHDETVIVSLSGKLAKKCKMTTQEEAMNLGDLTFWLYAFGYVDEVEEIYESTLDVPFPGRAKFDVWDNLLCIWGLEVHILQQRGEQEKADQIIDVIDKYLKSSPLTEAQEQARRMRFDYKYALNEERIAKADSIDRANGSRIVALKTMLGRMYTGLFPNLTAEKERIEKKAEEYMAAMRESYNAAAEYDKLAEQMYKNLKKATQVSFIHFSLENKKPGIFDSKIGGAYYIPEDENAPVDQKTGNPLYLLAQINFGQFKVPEPFPDKGLLQFFVTGDDDMYGLDLNDRLPQKSWAIRYYEELPEQILDENICTLTADQDTILPVYEEYKLKPHKGKHSITMTDYRFDSILCSACEKELKVNQHSALDLNNDLYRCLEEKIATYPCQIGGYPSFMQADPRVEFEVNRPDLLLFQLDSAEGVVWGDYGIGNFFINEEDLKNRDFSKVLYEWACG